MRMGEMAAHSSSGLGAGHKNVLAEREGGAIRYQYFNEPAAVMLFSPNDRLLAIAGQDSWLAVIDVTTGSELFRNDRLRARIRALTFSPDGARLATGHEDSTITLWEIPQTK